ncbi:c-type cytochrome [Pseudomonas azerbaijanoccidentalis]
MTSLVSWRNDIPILRVIVILGGWVITEARALDAPPEVQACVACHGAKGEGTSQGPMLAGLFEPYLSAQIENFIAGRLRPR